MSAAFQRPNDPFAVAGEVTMSITRRTENMHNGMEKWLRSDAARGIYTLKTRPTGDSYELFYEFSDASTAVAFRLRWT